MPDKALVIVESPSKAKTIEKFLGTKYKVIATKGHLRDLPKSRMGVDIDNNFEPDYINVRGKGDTIKEIKAAVKSASKVYLATDPDREGEAISWHMCMILGIDPLKANRIEFHEITKPAVVEAVKKPRAVDMNLVFAQQGRRVLDRVVGYKISPLLWAKVAKGLSAGRVQSAALKLICDREKEIEGFIPKEYWNIKADITKNGLTPAAEKKATFSVKLEQKNGKKITIADETESNKILKELATNDYVVSSIEKKQLTKKPYAPYTTSVLQQDASIKLGFSPKKTMMVAQELYEGTNIKGKGTIGLVTYIRTDSVRISEIADVACKEYIKEKFTEKYLGNNVYTNKRGNAQDAHEAIRPSYVDLAPEDIKDSLTTDQFKLYRLIWSRFVASRMKAAIFDSVNVDVKNGAYTFKASGKKMNFDGFLKVYSDADEKDKMLPEMTEGEVLKLLSCDGEQKFTEAPSRYTEASLIKELEDKGIGRPSTYAPIVSNLTDKRYIYKEKKALGATELGLRVTSEIMEHYFKELVDADFTAGMEEKLDKVEEGNCQWQEVVSDYYNTYVKEQLALAEGELEKVEIKPELTDELCPECGKPLAIRHGKFGDFLACSGFPECRFTKSIIQGTGVNCPKCGKEIIAKRSRKGKLFYGCSGYPDCDQVFWYKPVNKTCPKCNSLLLARGKYYICSGECGYSCQKDAEKEK